MIIKKTTDSTTVSKVSALDLKSVKRQFGALVAVEDISMTLRPGERRAVLGSNGAGKTTLFNLITGDLALSSGSVQFFGQDVSACSAQ